MYTHTEKSASYLLSKFVTKLFTIYSRRAFIRKSKHRKHPNNAIIEGQLGIVVSKAITAVSNFLTTCAVADGS
jgi:hypothetical protein